MGASITNEGALRGLDGAHSDELPAFSVMTIGTHTNGDAGWAVVTTDL